ncbi:MAG: arylesterase [bacterium]|nr:arylesterase [Deltaproteobacteria bacterium]MCP4904282.1 arylesterase [bacterium]
MRNPIRIEEARAAQSIHYCLVRTCASSSSPFASIPSLSAIRVALLALALSIAGCSDSTTPTDPGVLDGSRSLDRAQTEPTRARTRAKADTPVIVFLGTSLTAGYGLEEDQAFPALIQQRIDEAELDYLVVNAGVSGDTSTGGLRRLAWLLRLPISVLVLELGANDMLRGQSVDQLRSNLEAILERTTENHPKARFVVAGMRAAPNLGRDYVEAFDAVYPALAEAYATAFVPFLLEDVAARRNLNQADGIHPTAEGHTLIAERLWKVLEPVLR